MARAKAEAPAVPAEPAAPGPAAAQGEQGREAGEEHAQVCYQPLLSLHGHYMHQRKLPAIASNRTPQSPHQG